MTDEAVSPLRQRMIEDMTIRKLAPKTQHDYVQRIKNFAAFLGRSPDTATFEDVRRYQLHLTASGVGVPTINQTVSTLRFFFRVTLKRHDIVDHTHVIHEPRKLPVVLKRYRYYVISDRPGRHPRDPNRGKTRLSAAQVDELVCSSLRNFLTGKRELVSYLRARSWNATEIATALETASLCATMAARKSMIDRGVEPVWERSRPNVPSV